MRGSIRTVVALIFLIGFFVGYGPVARGAEVQEAPSVGVRLAAEGLTSPVTLVEPPDGTGRLFVVDQIGLIRILMPNGQLLPEPFLDVRDRMVRLNPDYDERGLLGLAFHPNFKVNRRFLVYYSAPLRTEAPRGWDHTSHLSEFTQAANDPNKADPASERVLLSVDQPQANHNGGTLQFGPDGMLFLSLGDGGGANDTGVGHVEDWYATNAGGNAQNVTENLLGKILRIDVDISSPYGIPPDNPFSGGGGLPEIFAYGLRNPYRFSFDMGGDRLLIVGDAGQDLWEEVSVIKKGGNYGWNVKEASHCFDAANPESPRIQTCPGVEPNGKPLIDPVIEYGNAKNGGIGLAVVGGFIYRGSAMPQFKGDYVFGDWSASRDAPDGSLFVAKPQAAGPWNFQPLRIGASPQGRLNRFVKGFGQDLAGEIYVLTSDVPGPAGETGKVFKLVQP